jgi:hypothetical protein
MDFSYPLPKANLHRRYDRVFSALTNSQSVNLIGLPLSSRSAFLKFILEYSPDFLHEFIPSINPLFVIINPDSLAPTRLLTYLTEKFTPLFSPKIVKKLKQASAAGDYYLHLIALENALSQLPLSQRIVLVIYDSDQLLSCQPDTIEILNRLYHLRHGQPDALITYCFIMSPFFLENISSPLLSPLFSALNEVRVNFPLFSIEELNYTRRRLEFFQHRHISISAHKLCSQLSGGHYLLYKSLYQLDQNQLSRISQTHFHPNLSGLLNSIASGLNSADKLSGTYFTPLLPIPQHTPEPSVSPHIPMLTSYQKLLFDYFTDHPSQIISRDQIAAIIWGSNSTQKYSDWAIDQLLSRLRAKLKNTGYQLSTIKNRGFYMTND